MRHSVDETVLLFTAPDLTHQKNRIDHEAGNDDGKENYAHDHQGEVASVGYDPAHVEKNGDSHQAAAQRDEKRDLLGPGCHADILWCAPVFDISAEKT